MADFPEMLITVCVIGCMMEAGSISETSVIILPQCTAQHPRRHLIAATLHMCCLRYQFLALS
jgi:hypothetical protein